MELHTIARVEIQGYEVSLGNVKMESEEDSDQYILIKLDHSMNRYIYISHNEKELSEIDNEISHLDTYNCANCGKTNTNGSKYYGCTISSHSTHSTIRNVDIRLCKNCKEELNKIATTAYSDYHTELIAQTI